LGNKNFSFVAFGVFRRRKDEKMNPKAIDPKKKKSINQSNKT